MQRIASSINLTPPAHHRIFSRIVLVLGASVPMELSQPVRRGLQTDTNVPTRRTNPSLCRCCAIRTNGGRCRCPELPVNNHYLSAAHIDVIFNALADKARPHSVYLRRIPRLHPSPAFSPITRIELIGYLSLPTHLVELLPSHVDLLRLQRFSLSSRPRVAARRAHLPSSSICHRIASLVTIDGPITCQKEQKSGVSEIAGRSLMHSCRSKTEPGLLFARF